MTLKPFDKVLVRDEDETNWKIDLFPHYNPDSEWLYECLETEWKQCVPYEGNEHLHNTCKKLKVELPPDQQSLLKEASDLVTKYPLSEMSMKISAILNEYA